MGYSRFHRSRQILPGVRLNLSKSGPSVSLGVKGATMNVGPQGVRTTVGVPGSGLSYISRQSWGGKASKIASQADPLAFMDAMDPAEKQALFTAQLKGKSIPRLQAERLAFEEAIAAHTEPLSVAEQADFEWMRAQYQQAIVTKWRDFGLAFLATVVAMGSVPLATETQLFTALGLPCRADRVFHFTARTTLASYAASCNSDSSRAIRRWYDWPGYLDSCRPPWLVH